MKSLIKLNIFFFLLHIILAALQSMEGILFFRIFYSLAALAVALVFSGINLAAVVQIIFRHKLDLWETVSIASVSSLILMPLALTVEYTFSGILFPWLPFLNAYLIFIFLAVLYAVRRKKDGLKATDFGLSSFEIKTPNVRKIMSSPFFWVFTANLFLISIIARAYYALPDLDPYYWLSLARDQFAGNSIPKLDGQRPFFSSLAYIFTVASKVDLYAYFKYVLPFIFLLALIPAQLVAKHFSKPLSFVILTLPLASASTILYALTPMPQAMVVILSFYCLYFLVYSFKSGKSLFYYSAGAISFLGFFYQETSVLIFSTWLAVTLIFNFKTILAKYAKNKLVFFLVAIIIFYNFIFIRKQLEFVLNWILGLSKIFSINPNWMFPAFYTNIDGNPMGWEGALGIVKYYSFYAGPFILLSVLFFLILSAFNKKFRQNVIRSVKTKKEFAVLAALFFVFFSISEIMPRVFNIALLPERAWIFGGIFASAFFFMLIDFFQKKIKWPVIISLAAFSLSVGGAIYINNLKKFIITEGHLLSAEWIRKNLPEKRIFFSMDNKNLIEFHSQSDMILVPEDFFYDTSAYEAAIGSGKHYSANTDEKYNKSLRQLKKNLEELADKKIFDQKDKLLDAIADNIEELKNLDATDSLYSEKYESPLYIYYSKEDSRNPYLNRPYYKKNYGPISESIFEKDSIRFQKIYEDKKNEITIWKIL